MRQTDSKLASLLLGALLLLLLMLVGSWGCMFEMYKGRTVADRPASSPAQNRAPAQVDTAVPLDEAVAELAKLIVDTLPEDARCAIYPPPIDGETVGESSQLATELETEAALASRGRARIITRSQLSVVLEEQNLQVGDLTQPDTQVRVGQMLGATHIVTGTLVTLHEDRFRWTLQVIDLTDGTVLGGTRQEVRFDSESGSNSNNNNVHHQPSSRDERVEATRRRGQSRWAPEFFEPFFSTPRFEAELPFDPYADGLDDVREVERWLRGSWQVDLERAPFEIRNNIRMMYGQITMHFYRGNRFSAAIAHTGERIPGSYLVYENTDHGPILELQYHDGTHEWAAIRSHGNDRLTLSFDGTSPLPMIRID